MNRKNVKLVFFSYLVFVWALVPVYATQNLPGDDGKLQFIVIGDWGTPNSKGQCLVARQMDQLASAQTVDFIITTGDNFYMRGVKSINDPLWKEVYEEVYLLPNLEDLSWYVSLGNHDHLGNIQAQIEYGKYNKNWVIPSRYHSTDIPINNDNLARFVFLDTSVFVERYRANPDEYKAILTSTRQDQLTWLENRLAEPGAAWHFVIGHHPVYSSGVYVGTGELKPVLPELFTKYGVQAYFAGHEHHLEHSKLDGVTHYIVSGGGSRTRRVKHQQYTEFALQSLGFAYVVVDENCMRLRFIDESGRDLYRTTIAAKKDVVCN